MTRRYGVSSLHPMLRNPGGFTLIELVVVLVLTGIIATFGVVKLGEQGRRLRVQAAAEQLVGDLHLARMLAAAENDIVSVVRIASPDEYQVVSTGGSRIRRLPDGVTFERGPYSVTFAPLGPLRAGGGSEYVLQSGSIRKTVGVNDAGMATIR